MLKYLLILSLITNVYSMSQVCTCTIMMNKNKLGIIKCKGIRDTNKISNNIYSLRCCMVLDDENYMIEDGYKFFDSSKTLVDIC